MIFVDTGAFIGRYLLADQHHRQAVIGWTFIQSQRIPLFTTQLVLSETITLLGRFADCRFAAETGRLILSSGAIRILRSQPDDERKALDLMQKYADQKPSFCDCVSFVMMTSHRIRDVFGFDRHFERAGFRLWNSDGERV